MTVEVKTLENMLGKIRGVITYEDEISFTCLGGSSTTQLIVRYVPFKKILEFISFRQWLRENYTVEDKDGTIESTAVEIYRFIRGLLEPLELEVINISYGSDEHGPADIKIGGIDI